MLQLLIEAEHHFRHVSQSLFRIGGNLLLFAGSHISDHIVRRFFPARLPFVFAHRDAGGEYGNEAYPLHHGGNAVRHRDQPQGQEFFHSQCRFVSVPQINHQPPERSSHQPAATQSRRHAPQDLERSGAAGISLRFRHREQGQAQHDERVSRAVVQASFAGQAEANAVAVAGVLFCTSEARIGSVGARMAASRMAPPSGSFSAYTPTAVSIPIEISMANMPSLTDSHHLRSDNKTRSFRPTVKREISKAISMMMVNDCAWCV